MIKKRIIALCTAFAVSAATLAVMSSADNTATPTAEPAEPPVYQAADGALLGVATHFHLFANEINLGSHVHGNVAANMFRPYNPDDPENVLGPDTPGKDFGIRKGKEENEGYSSINYIRDYEGILNGDSLSTLLVVGSDITVEKSDNGNKTLLKNSEGKCASELPRNSYGELIQEDSDTPYIDIDKELNEFFAPMSTELAAGSKVVDSRDYNDGIVAITSDGNNKVEIKCLSDEENLNLKYTLKLSQFRELATNIANERYGMAELEIRGVDFSKGQFLYLTIDIDDDAFAESVDFNKAWKYFYVDENGEEKEHDHGEIPLSKGGGRILYNFVKNGQPYEGKITLGDYKLGSVLAPKSYIVNDGNTCGTIIADKILCTGESHRWDVQIEGTYGPNIEKSEAEVKLNKVDLGGTDIVGARMKLTGVDAEGNTIKFSNGDIFMGEDDNGSVEKGSGDYLEWITGDGITYLYLEDGIYTLTETVAPHGYTKITEITFEVKDGKVVGLDGYEDGDVFEIVDDDSTVSIVKVGEDGDASAELPGASMELTYEGTGSLVNVTVSGGGKDVIKSTNKITWTSGTTSVDLKNIPNGSYTLKETTAPDGYEIATEITFDVVDGVVTNVVAKNGSTFGNGVIAMFDAAKATVTTTAPDKEPEPEESTTTSEPKEDPKPEESTTTSEPKEDPKPEESTTTSEPKEDPKPEESTTTSEPKDDPKPEESTTTSEPKEDPKPDESTTTSEPKEDPKPDESTTTSEPKDDPKPEETTTTSEPKEDPKPEETTTTASGDVGGETESNSSDVSNEPSGNVGGDNESNNSSSSNGGSVGGAGDSNGAGAGSANANNKKPSSPITGEAAPIALVVALIAAGGAITLTRKKIDK